MFPSQKQQLDHRLRTGLLPTPLLQLLPQPVEAARPQPSLSPLLQWARASERSRFLLKHVQVVLQIQDMLAAAVASLVRSHLPAAVPDTHLRRQHPDLCPGPRPQRRRVPVAVRLDTAFGVHDARAPL